LSKIGAGSLIKTNNPTREIPGNPIKKEHPLMKVKFRVLKKINILCLILLPLTATYAQDLHKDNKNPAEDSIVIKTNFAGYRVFQGHNSINLKQLVNTMKPNEQAYKMIKSARSTYTIATILNYAGGFMIGWTLGMYMVGEEPDWGIAGVGVGLAAVSIPIIIRSNKKAKQAINVYNSQFRTASFSARQELRFQFTGNGIGLAIRF
jgi:hypothetical protein